MNLGHESHGIFGLLAKISQLPVGFSGRAHWDNVEVSSYTVPTMDTYSFKPALEFVKKSIKSVSAELVKSGKSLYVVTGTKVARGAQVRRKNQDNLVSTIRRALTGGTCGKCSCGGG